MLIKTVKLCFQFSVVYVWNFVWLKLYAIYCDDFSRPQLLDLAAAAQTDFAVEAAIERLESESTYQMKERFVMATSFSSHPRESLLKALVVSLTLYLDWNHLKNWSAWKGYIVNYYVPYIHSGILP